MTLFKVEIYTSMLMLHRMLQMD